MIKAGTHLWKKHPHVANNLSIGERAADWLKHWFGTWTALFGVFGIIGGWILMQKTSAHWDIYPFILLNLVLSCVAAVQGIILQISANRGDKINAEVALSTLNNTKEVHENTKSILSLTETQMTILDEIKGLRSDVAEAQEDEK